MAIQRYQPARSLLAQFNDEINRMFLNEADRLPVSAGGRWRPAVDIREDDTAYRIEAEVPGIDPKDIEVTLDQGVLTLSGERRSVDADEDDATTSRHVERSYGRFVRRFSLPETVDEDSVEARADHGVLKLAIAKKAKSQPRRIEVRA